MARKKKTNETEEKKNNIKFSIEPKRDSFVEQINSAGMTESMRQSFQTLKKTVKPQTINKDFEKKYDKSKITFSSSGYEPNYDGVEQKGWRRLSDSELRELAQVDPYISAIVAKRCAQGTICGRPSDSKFDKGLRVSELDPLAFDDFESKHSYKNAQKSRKSQMKAIMSWFSTCGTSNAEVINTAFVDADPTFKRCTLPEFIAAQLRNLLTFGRCGTQVIRNEDGLPVMFRPVPIETIHPVAGTSVDINITSTYDVAEQSVSDVNDYNKLDEDERPAAYVQRVDGRNVNFFTEEDLKVWYFQKQALFDLNGFPLSPIEQAIYMVFVHQQTLSYLRNQFVKGMATKGIFVIKSTDPMAQLSDEDTEQIRRDFNNFVNRNDNSATIPLMAGPIDVSFVPLSPAPKDMEFLQVEEHIIRALCSSFQISPQEMGYGHLSIGQGSLTQGNKQDEVIRSEETGLRMLLDIVFDGLNEILFENFPEAEDLFRLTYVGVGEDTREATVGRNQQELQTTATLSSLWADSEKTDPVPFGGNVPLAPLFHQAVVRLMKYGEFREHFFGDKDASKKPEYDFIIDGSVNQAYQQLRAAPIEIQQEQTQMGVEQQKAQIEAQSAQMQQQGAMQQQAEGMPSAQQGSSQSEQQGSEQPEQAEKSLRDEFNSRQKLEKSIGYYFREWLGAHK